VFIPTKQTEGGKERKRNGLIVEMSVGKGEDSREKRRDFTLVP